MGVEVLLRRAEPGDADALAEVSRRSFDSDVEVGAPGPGGPPGYDQASWQRRMMRTGDYWCVVVDGGLAGGAIVFDAGEDGRELGRLFLDPAWHRRGIGRRVMGLLEEQYPDTGRWMLDTPSWNPRTRGFYEALGFIRYGSLTLDGGLELALYERRTDRLS